MARKAKSYFNRISIVFLSLRNACDVSLCEVYKIYFDGSLMNDFSLNS